MLARSERAWSPGSPNAKLGASRSALLGRLQFRGLRQTPSSSPNYGCWLPPGPFPLKPCGAVWSRGLGGGGGRLVTMGISRSKWGARAGIWVGQWRAGGGGAPRSGTTGKPTGLTSEVRALVGGPGPEGSPSPSLRWRPGLLPDPVMVPVCLAKHDPHLLKSEFPPSPSVRSQG